MGHTPLTNQSVLEISSLPYAREIQDYLIELSVAATGKLAPPQDYIRDLNRSSKTFVTASDIRSILDDISALYRTNGYMKPRELENALIRRRQPNIPEQAIVLADSYAMQDTTNDNMTGYLHKTHVPLSVGLAALYQRETGQPVSILEFDYSNMRGTNEHFAKVLAAANNTSPESTIREAMGMTDHAARVISTLIVDMLRDYFGHRDGFEIVPLRSGGDEIRIVMPNIAADDVNAVMDDIHAAIEKTVGMMDLDSHIHAKYPDDPLLKGFGAYGTAFDLEAKGASHYNGITAKADHAIQTKKIERRTLLLRDARIAPVGDDHPLYNDSSTAESYLRRYTSSVDGFFPGQQAILPFFQHPTSSLEELALSLSHERFLTPKEIQDHFYSHLSVALAKNEFHLSPKQERFLHVKIAKFPAYDYASGTLLSRDMPAMAGAAMAVIQSVNLRNNRNDTPWTLGVSFHNLAGLNEALGHETSNLVLQHQAEYILQESLSKNGIARENIVISHTGGGEFRIIVQPAIPRPDGTVYIVGLAEINRVQKSIQEKTATLNGQNIRGFIHRHGLNPPENGNIPQHFADIPNPRRPGETGISTTISAQRYRADPSLNIQESQRGGAIFAFIGDHIEKSLASRNRNQSATTATLPLPAPQGGTAP